MISTKPNKLAGLLFIIVILSQVCMTQYIQIVNYAVSDLRLSHLFRISFRPMIDRNDLDLSDSARTAYIDGEFAASRTTAIELYDENGVIVPDVKAEIIENTPLAKAFFSLECEWTPSASHEPYPNSGLKLLGSDINGVTKGPNAASEKIHIPAQYVIGTDVKNIMYIIFQIANIIFFVARYGITFLRPFMSVHNKLKTAWVGQTVIYFQLLCFTGLTPGAFGWTIDKGQEGMMKATRYMFFLKSVLSVNEE